MDYRDNRQRWAESHQVVHFYAGQWCTFTPALTSMAALPYIRFAPILALVGVGVNRIGKVLSQALLMLSREGKQTDRGGVGAEFIGYDRRRREALLLQEFPHQPNCRPSVPAGLNQEIQDFALTVHGTPEIELPPSNYDDHLVQVPAFGRSWPPTLNPPRIGPTEFQDPSSNCLIRDVETTLGKQVLNVPIAQRETAIEPDGMLDDDRWKAVTTVGYHRSQ